MISIDKFFAEKILKLKNGHLFREISENDRKQDVYIKRNGQNLLSFSSNDYLGLAFRREIINSAKKALEEYGSGSGSSLLITGGSFFYSKLEEEIASHYNKEASCVFSSGYMANIGSIPALVGKDDLIIADKLSHSCLIEASKLSGAEFKRFKHNDLNSLERIIKQERNKYKNCLIVTESVFSMDGDEADIPEIVKIAKSHNCWSYVDYAHDIKNFSTTLSIKNAKPDFVMGTLSKAVPSLGGYVAASDNLIKYIKSSSKTLIYSTALPPSSLAASIEAMKIIKIEGHELFNKVMKNVLYFRGQIEKLGRSVNIGKSTTQIVPVIIGDSSKAIEISRKLEKAGILIHAIRTPTVPKNEARLRISFSASHSKENIDRLVFELLKLI